jgi:D-3-phosphoglycerate dehydrogenase
MWKVLANDGMADSGRLALEELGHSVDTNHYSAEEIKTKINDFEVLIVRSATKVRKELLDCMTTTKLIIRAGVGLDNIDVEYAQSRGIAVHNTPTASSRSVAELSFGHILGMYRFLPSANKLMPKEGQTSFKAFKKAFSKGQEIEGKRLGIIGLGRIGRELARIALGAGMNVIAYDPWTTDNEVTVRIANQAISINIPLVTMEDLLAKSDVISLHVPMVDKPIIGREEISKCKDGVYLINTARGGSIDEDALLEGIASNKIAGAALDVFVGEPTPRADILINDRISLSPHIGASTLEAQDKIAQIIVELIDNAYRAT